MTRHLLIVDHYAVPPQSAGFSRQYHHARRLQEMGWETSIVTCGYNHKTHQFERSVSPWRSPVVEKIDGVEFRWIYGNAYFDNSWKRYLNLMTFAAIAFAREFRGPKPDVVIGANPDLLTAWAAYWLARRFRVPFIFEVQDLWPDSLVQLGLSNLPVIKTLEALERFLYSHSAANVALTDGVAEGIRSKLKVVKPVILIPTGADPVIPITSEERSQERSARRWEDGCVVIWAGAHGAANNLETIIEAARLDANADPESRIRWVLLGDGPEKPRLMEMAIGLPNIEFLPPIPSADVSFVLQLSDIGLVVHQDTPAVRGARPTKLAEYMATGLPIISNLQGESAHLIELARCGVTVPAMQPLALMEAVRSAAIDRERFRALGKAGQQFVGSEYSRSIQAARLAELLNSVIEKSS